MSDIAAAMAYDDDFDTNQLDHKGGSFTSREGKVSLILQFQDALQIVPLEHGQPIIIGRGRQATVTFDDNNLSRIHAKVELIDEDVWIDDQGSKNGTFVNGRRVKRHMVRPGDRIVVGLVTGSLHSLGDLESYIPNTTTHDKFMARLEQEVERARGDGGSLAVIVVRGTEKDRIDLAGACERIETMLASRDMIAAYSPVVVEILLTRPNPALITHITQSLAERKLLCGVASYPYAAVSVPSLHDAAREAAQRATPDQPTLWAPKRDSSTWWAEEGEVRRSGMWPTAATSLAIREVREMARRVAPRDMPVLLIGESGVGKEVIAKLIHDASMRAQKPMICVNCGLLTEPLQEHKLFGHETEVLTKADRQNCGVFEEADGGTVLLDEVGKLLPSTQAALLKMLETRQICRVGSSSPIRVDVRILAATSEDLEQFCRAGSFRADLLSHLSSVTLTIPPLRERREEIAALARHFLSMANQMNECKVRGFNAEVLNLLRQHDWPGNVRELRAVVERAVVIAGEGEIGMEYLTPQFIKEVMIARKAATPSPGLIPKGLEPTFDGSFVPIPSTFKDQIQQMEAALIGKMLASTGWNKTRAAMELRIPLRSLTEKMDSYNISAQRYRHHEAERLIEALEQKVPVNVERDELGLDDLIQRYEAALIVETLERSGWNKNHAAHALKMSLQTLEYKILSYRLEGGS